MRRALLPMLVILPMLAFIYLPVLTLVLFSLHDGRVPVPPFKGPTLEWYGRVLANPRITTATLNSVGVAGLSAAISVALAMLAAWGLARHRVPGRRLIEAAILMPLTVSYLVVGLGLMVSYAGILPKSLALVVIGHVVLNMPLAFSILYVQFDRDQERLEMAARDLGATETQVFWRVTVPTLRVALLDPQTREPLPGYSLEECQPLRTNSVRAAALWNGRDDLSSLAGRDIRLAFAANRTKLFSFYFEPPAQNAR